MPFVTPIDTWKNFQFHFLGNFTPFQHLGPYKKKTIFTCRYATITFSRMSFILFNPPTIFQRCMMLIFSDMVEHTIEVFMDDFDVIWDLLSTWYLEAMWRVSPFVELGKVSLYVQGKGHRISIKGIEVDKAKVEIIEKLSLNISIKGLRSYLRHTWFFWWFIKRLLKYFPLCKLLEKDAKFMFDDSFLKELEGLK